MESSPSTGNRAKGIWCILASAFGFALMAAAIRLCDDFGGPVSSFQKSFFRNLIALVLAASVYCRHRGGGSGMAACRSWTLWLRAILGTCGIFANFYALSHIPIAEGQTLNKTAPFFTVAFAWLFLGERMSFRQMGALAVAFGGVLLIAKPGFAGEETFPMAMGLLGGICAGSACACLRQLGLKGVDGAFVVLFFSAFSCLASIPFMVFGFDPMTAWQVLILLGAGGGAAIGQFGITAAYRYAAPRSIALFDYTSILFAALFGYVLFDQVPDALSVLGFAVIIFAAWFVLKTKKSTALA